MDKRKTVLLSLLLFMAFAIATVLYTAAAASGSGVRISARGADEVQLMTGGDDAGRESPELLPGERIDINTATAEQLQKLPGIGEALAQAIMEYRETEGPFRSPEEIMKVYGIGQGRYEAIADNITVGDLA